MTKKRFPGRRRLGGTLGGLALATCTFGAAEVAAAASLDGAGRIVIVPYVVSGLQRESTIYITNPSDHYVTVQTTYVGAEATPFAASQSGPTTCSSPILAPGESIGRTLSSLCGISTPDLENVGYLKLETTGGFDTRPFEVTSLVDVVGAGHFGVEGVPAGAFDRGQTSAERASTLRVHDLIADVGAMAPDLLAQCAVATLDEPKDVSVQLQEYSAGVANPLGSPFVVSLLPQRMVVVADIFRAAGVPPGRAANVTAEFHAIPVAGQVDGTLIAWCSVESRPSLLADVRLAETPSPNDRGRSRDVVRADSEFEVGPFQVGWALPLGAKVGMSLYLRHEDRVRCYLTESRVRPNWGASPWQELRVLDPDGNVVAGGNDINDTLVFFTGPKNERRQGVNGRWTVEVSWSETTRGDYSQIPKGNRSETFGVECVGTNGLAQLLPLDTATDDF